MWDLIVHVSVVVIVMRLVSTLETAALTTSKLAEQPVRIQLQFHNFDEHFISL